MRVTPLSSTPNCAAGSRLRAVFIVVDENLRDLRGPEQLANKANSQSFPTVPAPTKNFRKDIAPLPQILMFESVAGQARPCRRACRLRI